MGVAIHVLAHKQMYAGKQPLGVNPLLPATGSWDQIPGVRLSGKIHTCTHTPRMCPVTVPVNEEVKRRRPVTAGEIASQDSQLPSLALGARRLLGTCAK